MSKITNDGWYTDVMWHCFHPWEETICGILWSSRYAVWWHGAGLVLINAERRGQCRTGLRRIKTLQVRILKTTHSTHTVYLFRTYTLF